MAERVNIPWQVKVAGAALPALALLGACGGGGKHKAEITSTAGAGTAPISTSHGSETRTPTAVFTSTVSATPESIPTAIPTAISTPAPIIQNNAAHFAEGLNNWIEVPNSEQFQGLSEFTILARVKLDGFPPDAVVAKGDKTEAFALFTSLLFSCPGGEMALVVDDKGFCSNLKVPRGKYVNVGVTFKDGGARFFVDDTQSLEVAVDRKVSVENGPLFIGASPRGLNEGFSGEIDSLVILNKALSTEAVRSGFAILQSADASRLVAAQGSTIAMWTFDGKSELNDVSGNGHNGKTHGNISLDVVK